MDLREQNIDNPNFPPNLDFTQQLPAKEGEH